MNTTATILLVDDLEENLIAMAALLRSPDVRVLMARSGAEALEILLVNEVALALVDVRMPDMDGFELAELMRGSERTKYVPIVFITAGAHDRQRQIKGFSSGAVDFLYKPVEPHVLTSKVAVFVELFRQKKALSRVSALQSAIFNSANFSSIATDANGVIQIFNVGAERMLGYTAIEVLNKITPADISDPQEVLERARALSLELGTAITPGFEALVFKASRGMEDIYEPTYIRKDGSRLSAVVSVTALRDAEDAIIGYLLIGTDNTARKQAQQELANSERELRLLAESRNADLAVAKMAADAANNAKSHFMAAASHDLRQPLTAISAYVEVLKNSMNPPEAKLLANMTHCVASLSELLTDLLDISKLEAGVVTPVLSDFPVSDMLNKLLTVHAPEAAENGLRLRLRPSTLHARSDRVWLARILGNFIANAVRYTQSGGVLVACRQHQGKTWIEVWDSGVGIAQKDIGDIFGEYRQLESVGHRQASQAARVGSGLGLAIAAKTAALLGLQVRVQSRLGRGSMFALELPQGVATSVVKHHEVLRKPLRIALVDDNALILEALGSALRSNGNQVVAASNGHELLALLAGEAPDVLISDYRLDKGETGFEVIAAVRAAFGENLPALLITGDTAPILLRGITTQGIAVQHKPLKFDELLGNIAVLTQGRIH